MWRRLGAAVIAVPLALRTLASRRLRSVRCALLSRWWRLLPDTQLPAPRMSSRVTSRKWSKRVDQSSSTGWI